MKKITLFYSLCFSVLSLCMHAQQETIATALNNPSNTATMRSGNAQTRALATIYDTSRTSSQGAEITAAANLPSASMGDAIVLAGTERFLQSITVDLFNLSSAAPFNLTVRIYTDCTSAGTGAAPCGTGPGVLIPGSVQTQTVTPGALGFIFQHTFNYSSLDLSTEVDNNITVVLNASRNDVFWRLGDNVIVGAQPAGEPPLSFVTRCGSVLGNNGCSRNFGLQNNFTMTLIADSFQGDIAECATDTPLPLGPGSGVTTLSTINISQVGNIGANFGDYIFDEVSMNLIHSWANDLEIVLISPSGTQVALSTDNGGSNGLGIQSSLVFRDDSPNNITAWTGGVPLANYRAEGGATAHPVGAGAGPGVNLNTVFAGQPINGNWTLRLYDDAAGDGGTIFDYCIDFIEITQIGDLPNIVCPLDIIINNTTGTCGAQVFFANAIAFDPEDGLIPVTQTMGPGTGSVFPIGDTIIQFSATDSDGNTSTCEFTITVLDVDDPTAVCQNITVELDGSGSVTINAADLDGGSSDLCGAVTFSFDMAGTVTTMMLDCSDLGENTITLYVTDEGGNVVSCESTVTVEDNIAPVIVCANAGGLNAISEDFNAGVPAGWSSVINTGNCAWEAGNLPYTGWSFPTPAMFFDDDACGPGAPASNATLFSDVYDTTGATSLDISFDLAYRHLGTSSFTVEAFDGAIWQPVATYNTNQQIVSAGPFDLLAYSNANFQVRFIYNDGSGWNWGVAVDNFLLEYETPAAAIPQYVLDINGEVTVDINDLYTSASDNCSVTVSAGGASGGTQELLNLGFAAGNGNFGTMFDVVALGDVTIDSFDVNAQTGAVLDIVVYYKDGTHAGFETNAAAWTLIGEAPGTVSAGVGIPTELNLDLAQGILAGETGAFYVTATNISGSNGFQYTNGTGVGNVWAEDANIQMLEGKAQTLLFGGSLFQPRVFNGNIHYSTGGGSGSGLTFTCDDLGIVNVVVTATDSSGNTTTCTTQIEIIDNMAPVIVGEDITVELGADGTVCIEPEDLFGMIPPEFNVITISSDNGSGSVGTTDLVVNVTTSVSVSFDWSYTTADGPGFDSFGYIINGVYTQLTDPTGPLNQTGNATVPLTAGQIFGFRSRSEDGTFGPSTTTVSNFQPGFVGQFAPANWTEVLTNSDGSAVFVEINPGSSSAFDNCGITVTAIDISCFTCADIGTPVTVTIFASDASGNIASTTAVVTVVDLLGPVIGCLDDMTVDTDPDSITYTLPDYIGEGLVSVTDNCTDPVTIFSQSPAPGTLLLDGTYTITFTAEDEYGNESSCSFELTVETILGIDENQLSDAIVMYPNPASAFVNLRNNSTIALTDASIYDITGKLVSKFDLSQMSGEQRLDVSNLASGVYMVYINSETASVVKRLIKK